jgi:hemin uptake protein HemP
MAGPRPDSAPAASLHLGSTPPASPSPDRPASPSAARRWRSSELFGSTHEIEIEHGQSVYRLRLTSLGKLILTK